MYNSIISFHIMWCHCITYFVIQYFVMSYYRILCHDIPYHTVYLLSYHIISQMTLITLDWPARLLCKKFPDFPAWIGDLCDIECIFGDTDLMNK